MGRALAVLVVLGIASVAHAQAPGSDAPPAPAAPPPTYAPPPPVYYEPPPQPERRDRGLIAMGVVVGGGGQTDWLYGAYYLEGGVTLLRASALRLRARAFAVLVGGTMESDWGGDFSRAGGGVEARTCTVRQYACAFADLDVGYQQLTLYDHGGSFVRSDTGTIVGPRIGMDLGAGVRLRGAFELYRMFAQHESGRTNESRSFGTFALTLALGYQL